MTWHPDSMKIFCKSKLYERILKINNNPAYKNLLYVNVYDATADLQDKSVLFCLRVSLLGGAFFQCPFGNTTQLAFTCSKSTMETPEQCVKSVQC